MRTRNFAHRGFKGHFPENTMLAFREAYNTGADGIELDVRLTRDKEVIIFHDETLDRLTEGEGSVDSYTLKEIQQFKIKDPRWPDLMELDIPTLADYLKWVKDKPLLTNIELKTIDEKDRELEEKVTEEIRRYGLQKKLIISSFYQDRLERMIAQLPEVQTALLVPEFNERVITDAKNLPVDFIHLKAVSVTREVVEEAHRHGKAISTWTVNDYEELKQLNKLLLFAIITDYPNRLKALQQDEDD
ncbi:glycerophosphodiester phosphodiesterase [Alkalibacterium psychrotolerans]